MMKTAPPAPPTERPPNTNMLWHDIAAAIRAMTPAELDAFNKAHGISVVSQDVRKLKTYDQMTPQERDEFCRVHGIRLRKP